MDNVIEFIKRRFPEDCNWKTGNCYWFAQILENRFDFYIAYDPIPGHFVAVDTETQTAYDWSGVYFSEGKLIPVYVLQQEDPLWWNRLVRDCIT